MALARLAGLGAFHGINPAMGWLFAVALGLQERRARAVWRALAPIAAGHAAVDRADGAAGGWRWRRRCRRAAVRIVGAAALVTFARLAAGAARGIRVGRDSGWAVRELAFWSFLMATRARRRADAAPLPGRHRPHRSRRGRGRRRGRRCACGGCAHRGDGGRRPGWWRCWCSRPSGSASCDRPG